MSFSHTDLSRDTAVRLIRNTKFCVSGATAHVAYIVPFSFSLYIYKHRLMMLIIFLLNSRLEILVLTPMVAQSVGSLQLVQ